jgi:hypothetical protein
MQQAYKKTSTVSHWLPTVLFSLLTLSFSLLTSCSLLEPAPVEHQLTEREKLFEQAEQDTAAFNEADAQAIYFKLTRNSSTDQDAIYDKSLWRLMQIYEKTDQPEKALLTLDELSKRPNVTISKNKIKFAQMKNHYRVTNFYQARKIKNELDEAYRNKELSLYEVYDDLNETASMYYDRHIIEELAFLGEVQKYFIFVMESNMTPENEQTTNKLIHYYQGFISALDKSTLSEDFRRQLTISLLDQLRKFDQYKMDGPSNPNTIARFVKFSEEQQKKLTESLAQ